MTLHGRSNDCVCSWPDGDGFVPCNKSSAIGIHRTCCQLVATVAFDPRPTSLQPDGLIM
jgi:hypothetical protein